MSASIAGAGWVTPLGSGLEPVWELLLAGARAQSEEISDPDRTQTYPVYRVPPTALKELPAHPRLRRASAISRYAAAAGLAALAEANVTFDEELARRSAMIFAVANGGVVYTRRFYSDIVKTGADAASPLLFPETVFNAAASHLAAIIGFKGVTYTVVADGEVGLTAVQMGEDLLANDDLDYCLVVAAEEADWLLCDAYKRWRLLRSKPPLEVFDASNKGTILSEGAGAILLSRTGSIRIAATAAGAHFSRRSQAAPVLARLLREVQAPANGIVVSSADGTFIDSAEIAAIRNAAPNTVLYSPKEALGESVGPSALWQLIVASQALRTQKLPRPQYPRMGAQHSGEQMNLTDCREITVLSCGLNQQAGATRLEVKP